MRARAHPARSSLYQDQKLLVFVMMEPEDKGLTSEGHRTRVTQQEQQEVRKEVQDLLQSSPDPPIIQDSVLASKGFV